VDAFGRIGLQLDDNFNGRNNYLLSAELTFNDANRSGGKWRNLLQLGRVTGLRSEFVQPFGGPARSTSSLRWRSALILCHCRWMASRWPSTGWCAATGHRGGVFAVAALADRARRNRRPRSCAADRGRSSTVRRRRRILRRRARECDLGHWTASASRPRACAPPPNWYRCIRGAATLDGEVARASLDWAYSRDRYHLLLGTRLASALQDDGFFQAQTFLGGFLNLSGFGERSLVGNQAALARAVVYRRVGDTTRIFAMPMFVGGSLEAGNVWDRRDDVDFGSLLVGGSLFTGFDTPLGPIFLGYGRNQTGADSWYLTFGSLLRQEPK
jgi:NTE family protein